MNVIEYWGNFAWHSDPNSATLPRKPSFWPQNGLITYFTAPHLFMMTMSMFADWPVLDSEAAVQQYLTVPACFSQHDTRAKYCDFWDELGYTF